MWQIQVQSLCDESNTLSVKVAREETSDVWKWQMGHYRTFAIIEDSNMFFELPFQTVPTGSQLDMHKFLLDKCSETSYSVNSGKYSRVFDVGLLLY